MWFALTFAAYLQLLSVTSSLAGSIPSFAGPYLLFMDKVYDCEPEGQAHGPMHVHGRLSHYNPYRPQELQRMTGNVTVDETIDDSHAARAVVDKWSNNEWKPNAFVFKFPLGACSTLRENVPHAFRAVFKSAPRAPAPCSIRKGAYVVANESVSWVLPNMPVLPYGVFRVRATVGRAVRGEPPPAFCGECQVVPRSRQ